MSITSLRSSLFRFLSGKRESREGSGTEVALAFSRLEETEKTATQASRSQDDKFDVDHFSRHATLFESFLSRNAFLSSLATE